MAGPGRAQLFTIPQSHYAEKARWALDRAGIDYVERPHAPLFHMLFTVPRGGRSVPVLVDGARCYVDSTEILACIDARVGPGAVYPVDPAARREVMRLEEVFDENLGPHARRWAYAQVLEDSRMLAAIMSRGIPAIERALLPLTLGATRSLIRRSLHITPEGVARSLERVRESFAEVGDRLADGRRFLVGDRLTAADITFASLAAPVLFPPGYRGSLPRLEEVPATAREEVLRFRQMPAGRYALRLFAEERERKSGPGS